MRLAGNTPVNFAANFTSVGSLRKMAPILLTLLGAPALSPAQSADKWAVTIESEDAFVSRKKDDPASDKPDYTGPITEDLPRYKSKTTVFCPEDPTVDRAMQGGMQDRRGRSIVGKSLQDYLEGRGDYVVVAMDLKAFPYGTVLRIPEIDSHYNRPIVFKVVGTGGAFRGKGTSRIDIMTRTLRKSGPIAGHMPVTLIPVHIPGQTKPTSQK